MIEKPNRPIADRMEELRYAVRDMIGAGISLPEATEAFKKLYATQAIVMCRGNQCKAAEKVQAHRNTLHRIIERKRA